ncbi:MAG: hypothetical protein JSW33_02670 [bacterium]|nr:MAG: hypothetical protein JSW33_02670 [bacterium]
MKRAKYTNQEAEVVGWYRRSPVPFIELKSIKAAGEKERKCYTYMAKYIWAAIVTIIGLAAMLMSDVIQSILQA